MNRSGASAPVPAATKTPLGAVIFGGTNVCNASCIHCPTNKPETEHVVGGVMPFEFFCSVVDQLAEGFTVSEWISFGLFGDSLLDPMIVERVKYAKSKFPNVAVAINSNGAAYSRARHAVLFDIVDVFTLHVESLKPDVYNHIMQPLRLERVLEKVHMIIEDFGRKVSVGIPLHRINLAEREDLISYFHDRGCGRVEFVPLSNRCSTRPQFDTMAFRPMHGDCRSGILRNFIVDWDGTVFPCCNDFRKVLPLGQLHGSSVREVLASPVRAAFGQQLDRGEWSAIPTCRNCLWDKCHSLGHHDNPELAPSAAPPGSPSHVAAGGAEAARLRAELDQVYASTSWRITGPLRSVVRLARR